MNLFDYQRDFKRKIASSFRRHNRVIGQLETGGGKGVLLADIVKSSIEKGNIPCVVCHRIEIFQQLFKNLIKFGIQPGLITSGQYPMGNHPCYLSMVETVTKRVIKGMTDHLGINFWIMDEIHIGNYYKLCNQIECKILGLTATPKSTGQPELKEYFDELICGIRTDELITIGRLLPVVTYSVNHDFSKVKMKGKDFDELSLAKEFKKPQLYNGAIDSFMKHSKDQKAICFNINVAHSIETTNQFRELGIKAAHVDGTTDEGTRNHIFNMYRNNEIQMICNVGIATTGTDLPDTGCVILNFATKSLVKYKQCVGRGARAHEDMSKFYVHDLGRNYLRFGEFGEYIDWNEIFLNPDIAFAKRERTTKKRECDNCGFVMKFRLSQCPSCDFKITEKEIESKFIDGASIEEVKEYRLRKLPVSIRKPVSELDLPQLKEYARIMGYNPKWVWKIHNLNSKRNN